MSTTVSTAAVSTAADDKLPAKRSADDLIDAADQAFLQYKKNKPMPPCASIICAATAFAYFTLADEHLGLAYRKFIEDKSAAAIEIHPSPILRSSFNQFADQTRIIRDFICALARTLKNIEGDTFQAQLRAKIDDIQTISFPSHILLDFQDLPQDKKDLHTHYNPYLQISPFAHLAKSATYLLHTHKMLCDALLPFPFHHKLFDIQQKFAIAANNTLVLYLDYANFIHSTQPTNSPFRPFFRAFNKPSYFPPLPPFPTNEPPSDHLLAETHALGYHDSLFKINDPDSQLRIIAIIIHHHRDLHAALPIHTLQDFDFATSHDHIFHNIRHVALLPPSLD